MLVRELCLACGGEGGTHPQIDLAAAVQPRPVELAEALLDPDPALGRLDHLLGRRRRCECARAADLDLGQRRLVVVAVALPVLAVVMVGCSRCVGG